MIRALVFDFDGLILETEGPIFASWQELYQAYGCVLTFEDWSRIIGTADPLFEPLQNLEHLTGRKLAEEPRVAKRDRREQELIAAADLQPGVHDYLAGARQLGLKVGLASSSPCSWVVGHLEQRGLLAYFDIIKASDDVRRTKPDPELYLAALAGLGVRPHEAIALEDSPNGIRAAKRAGMYCLAVPTRMTASMDTSEADLQVASLEELSLPGLLEYFNKR
jgi:HAD superfamily hydrolase (TIGR01509 family)